MNETKWDELRLALYGLGGLRPKWRTRDLPGYLSPWDGEWFYHFQEEGYGSIEWVEIRVAIPEQVMAVEAALRQVHVPGHRVEHSFRVFADEYRWLFGSLADESLRVVALLKLEGYSNEEIARSLDCSLRTEERKLEVIRKLWTAEGTP
jgi:hypothetical protein